MSEGNGLPTGWHSVCLAEVARVNPGKVAVNATPQSEFAFVPMQAVTEEYGGIDVSTRRPYCEVEKGYTQFVTGDVLAAKITPCMENGKIAVVPILDSQVAFGSTEFYVIRPQEGIDPKWLAHYISQKEFRRNAKANMTGSAGQLRVPKNWLESQRIPLAPRFEQRRIVAKLEELFSDLDAGVAALERARANLKRYRASVLKAAVEGRLTEEWRKKRTDVEPAEKLLERILAERRRKWEAEQLAKFKAQGKAPLKNWKAKYKEPAAPESANLPALPKGWCWATTDQIFWFVTSGSRGWAKYYSELGDVFIRIGNLDHDSISLDLSSIQYVSPSESAEAERTRVLDGDILISITADVGMVALVPSNLKLAYINQHIALARTEGPINREYLAWFLASERGGNLQFKKMQRGATKLGLGLDDIRGVLVPLPPLDEQREISNVIDTWLSISDQVCFQIEQSRNRSIRLRQSILKRAFEGNLVPQDPGDEPASKLLERIKSERESRATEPRANGRGKRGRPRKAAAKDRTPTKRSKKDRTGNLFKG